MARVSYSDVWEHAQIRWVRGQRQLVLDDVAWFWAMVAHVASIITLLDGIEDVESRTDVWCLWTQVAQAAILWLLDEWVMSDCPLCGGAPDDVMEALETVRPHWDVATGEFR